MPSAGTIIRKRPASIVKPSVTLYQGVLALRPAKAEPLLPAPLRERVEHLGEAVWPGVVQRRRRRSGITAPTP